MGGQNVKHAYQKKAWMEKHLMHEWIDAILEPYKREDERDPGGLSLMLILDAYYIHLCGSLVNCIQEMCVKVLHIPAGCMYLCQSIDIRVNKTLMRELDDGRRGHC